MLNRSEIKEESKDHLSGKWSKSVCITALYKTLIAGVIALIFFPVGGILLQVIIAILSGVLALGLYRYFLRLARDENCSIKDLFTYTLKPRMIFKTLWLYILITFFIFLNMIAGIISFAILIGVFENIFINPDVFPGIVGESDIYYRLFSNFPFDNALVFDDYFYTVISFFLSIGAVASYRYRLAAYVLIDSPEISAKYAIKQSKIMMFGNKLNLFIFDLSFLGWGLLSVITLGLASFWVDPYFRTAEAVYYNKLKLTTPQEAKMRIFNFLNWNFKAKANANKPTNNVVAEIENVETIDERPNDQ